MSSPSPLREIVIHQDDVASSHGANLAFMDLFARGICTSGSVMVPCPWFPEIAAFARTRPELDLGVHLTLTAEMVPYRWRPLTGVSANGLTDPDGYFWARAAAVRRADPRAVEAELRAQIDAALAAGIDATHLDSHMGTVMLPEFLEIYLRLGEDYRLPIMLPRNVIDLTPAGAHLSPPVIEAALERLARAGNPVFEEFLQTPWNRTGPADSAYRALFAGAGAGPLWAALHFTAPGDIEAIAGDAAIRISEYEYFRSGRATALLTELGLQPVGMRMFRDQLRDRRSRR